MSASRPARPVRRAPETATQRLGRLLDMFPQTTHYEVLVLLTR